MQEGAAEEGTPIVFHIQHQAKVVGCLIYGLAVPVISLGIGALAGALVVAILHSFLEVPEEASMIVGGLVGLALAGLISVWGFREYRRRGGGEVRIWTDRIERTEGTLTTSLEFDRLGEFEYYDTPRKEYSKLVLKGEKGGRMELLHTWPLAEIVAALTPLAVPVMSRRLLERLERGETLEFREKLGRALMGAFGGLLFCGWGATAVASFVSGWVNHGNVRIDALLMGLALAACGIGTLVWTLRIRGGGVSLTRTGVRRSRQEFGAETAWEHIDRVTFVGDVLRLEGDLLERPFQLSTGAPNFRVYLHLLGSLVRPELREGLEAAERALSRTTSS